MEPRLKTLEAPFPRVFMVLALYACTYGQKADPARRAKTLPGRVSILGDG